MSAREVIARMTTAELRRERNAIRHSEAPSHERDEILGAIDAEIGQRERSSVDQ